jgi:hypothetical protein
MRGEAAGRECLDYLVRVRLFRQRATNRIDNCCGLDRRTSPELRMTVPPRLLGSHPSSLASREAVIMARAAGTGQSRLPRDDPKRR